MTLRPEDFPIARPEGAADFDFLLGRWRVHNRRLWERLVGASDWEEFGASLEVRPILGGLGNVDQYRTIIAEKFFEGMSLRLFDLASSAWHIYRADTEHCRLRQPVVGVFEGGVGTFRGYDEHRGQPVDVRFDWRSLSEHEARWEQAFSADKGVTWETNWIMELARD